MARRALFDGLTGLPNRLLLLDRLEQTIAGVPREGSAVSLLVLDLDQFRYINDSFGHQLGDMLLQMAARRLKGLLRAADTVARLGGDEFAVLLPATGTEGALQVARKVVRALEQPFLIGEQVLEVRASVGAAVFPQDGEDAGALLRGAEAAMYVAKRTGSGYALHAFEQDIDGAERLRLLSELRQAIEFDQLTLHYQPKVDLAEGRLLGVEALVRWQHPERGLVPPDAFIPLAEQTGLIRMLTWWVLNAALRQAAEWRRDGRDIRVAVNLSARNLQDMRLPDLVGRLLARWKLPAGALSMEITESAVIADPQRAIEVVNRLRKMGVRFSIDDFGTGYASLAYLKQLPAEELKIDRSFVMNMNASAEDRAIVRAAIEMGHSFGLQVVAEGVENLAVWEELAALGCDVAQGYHISRPVPGAAFLGWLEGCESCLTSL